MPRYYAFLRAVNIGGRVVKMDHLRRLFEAFEFTGVDTFIASGNVVFHSRATAAAPLERRIERGLRDALGYDVATFVRSADEIAALVSYQPFKPAVLRETVSNYLAFLKEAPDADAKERVMALRPPNDVFHFAGKQFHVASPDSLGETRFKSNLLEKALGAPVTVRFAHSVRKFTEKHPVALKANPKRKR